LGDIAASALGGIVFLGILVIAMGALERERSQSFRPSNQKGGIKMTRKQEVLAVLKKEILRLRKLLGVAAILALAAAGAWALGAFNAVPSFCFNGATGCAFSIAPSGSIRLNADGSGQSIVPGDTRWTYFSAGTTTYEKAGDGPCPGLYCELFHVTVNEFSFIDTTTNTTETVFGEYEVEQYPVRGRLVTKPLSGGLTVTVQ
jgi:hypothetical protein